MNSKEQPVLGFWKKAKGLYILRVPVFLFHRKTVRQYGRFALGFDQHSKGSLLERDGLTALPDRLNRGWEVERGKSRRERPHRYSSC